MNSKRLLQGVFVLLVILLTILLFKKNGAGKRTFSEEELRNSYNLKQLKNMVINEFRVGNIEIDQDLQLLTTKGSKISIMELSNKFVIRFTDIGCTSCVKYFVDHVEEINEFIKKIGVENVVMLLNTNSTRDILTFKSNNKIPCAVYALPLNLLPTEKFDNEIGDSVIAYYYFVVSNKFALRDFFVPIQEFPQRDSVYMNYIKRHFEIQAQ